MVPEELYKIFVRKTLQNLGYMMVRRMDIELFCCMAGKAIDLSDLVKSLKESGGSEQAAWSEITRRVQEHFFILQFAEMLYLFKKKLLMASGVVFKPSP
jgi:hypothetical protein